MKKVNFSKKVLMLVLILGNILFICAQGTNNSLYEKPDIGVLLAATYILLVLVFTVYRIFKSRKYRRRRNPQRLLSSEIYY